jgi:predicted ATPase
VKAGHGQVVCIAGEAGIGKSRHVFELRRRLAAAGDAVTWLEGQCLSFGQTMPFLPVVDQLRAYFEIAEADSPSEIRQKVANGMRHLGTLEAHLPALHYLLAVETGDSILGTLQPATRRKRLFDALLALALGNAQRQPLILVYEDLHWIDTSTETLLHALKRPQGCRSL